MFKVYLFFYTLIKDEKVSKIMEKVTHEFEEENEAKKFVEKIYNLNSNSVFAYIS